MSFWVFESWVSLLIAVAMLGIKGFAFVSAVRFPQPAYEATGKLTKQAWCAILGLGFAAQLIVVTSSSSGMLFMVNLAFTIAAFVYLADVRPALASVTGRR